MVLPAEDGTSSIVRWMNLGGPDRLTLLTALAIWEVSSERFLVVLGLDW